MKTLNATDAKREFGDMLLKVQNEPISINKNGKPVAVVLSAQEFEMLSALKKEWLKIELQKGVTDLKAGKVKDGSDVLEGLRKRALNAEL